MDKVGEIKKLKNLLEKGAITQEEFDCLKKQVIEFKDDLSVSGVMSTPSPKNTLKKEEVVTPSKGNASQKPTLKEAFRMLDKMDVAVVQQNLIHFSEIGDLKKVELLIIAGLDPNIPWYKEEQGRNIYSLHNTAGFGKSKMVKFLIENGTSVNLEDDRGYTALFYAIENGKEENVKILIENGANVNHLVEGKFKPLPFAIGKKQNDIASILERAGADKIGTKDRKAIKKVEFENGNKTTIWFIKINLALSAILGIVLLAKLGSFLLLLVGGGLGFGLTFFFGSKIIKRSNRNTSLIALSIILSFLIFVPNYSSTSTSGSNMSSESQVDEGDAEIRRFLINNIFVNYGNGGEAYLRFDDNRAGWYGLVTLTFGGCDFIYNYETKGSRVNLDYNYSTCSGFSGGRASVRVNKYNNTLTVMFDGRELVFRPLF